MDGKPNLLISGLGGSLFPYLHLQLSSKYNLYYLDSDAALTSLYPDLNFYHAPLVVDPAYFHLVKEIIIDKKIHFYVPLIDEELFEGKRLEGFNGVSVIAPSAEFINLSLDKYRLMHVLENTGVSRIKSFRGVDNLEIDFPVFVKPIFGRGSRGIRKIKSARELDAYFILEGYKPENVLVQELIEGTEYTVGVTVSSRNEVLEISSKRIIRKKGVTIIAVTERNERISACARDLVRKLKPCGPINIQLFIDSAGAPRIFEVNPRFSTTTIMSYAAGIDVVSLYVEAMENRVPASIVEPPAGLVLHRRWENIFYET